MFTCAVPYAKRVFFRFSRLGAVVVLASASHLAEVFVLCGHDGVDLLRGLVNEVLFTSAPILSRKASLITQHILNDLDVLSPLSN